MKLFAPIVLLLLPLSFAHGALQNDCENGLSPSVEELAAQALDWIEPRSADGASITGHKIPYAISAVLHELDLSSQGPQAWNLIKGFLEVRDHPELYESHPAFVYVYHPICYLWFFFNGQGRVRPVVFLTSEDLHVALQGRISEFKTVSLPLQDRVRDAPPFADGGIFPLNILARRNRNDREEAMALMIARLLLRHGANPDAVDIDQKSPMEVAKQARFTAMTDLLLRHDATMEVTEAMVPAIAPVRWSWGALWRWLRPHEGA